MDLDPIKGYNFKVQKNLYIKPFLALKDIIRCYVYLRKENPKGYTGNYRNSNIGYVRLFDFVRIDPKLPS